MIHSIPDNTNTVAQKQGTKTMTVGVLAESEWDSFVQVDDFISEVVEYQEEESEDTGIDYHTTLLVRHSSTTQTEDMAMHIAEKQGWDVECSDIPDLQTALKNFSKKCDVIMFFLAKQGTKMERIARDLQKEYTNLRIKVG